MDEYKLVIVLNSFWKVLLVLKGLIFGLPFVSVYWGINGLMRHKVAKGSVFVQCVSRLQLCIEF